MFKNKLINTHSHSNTCCCFLSKNTLELLLKIRQPAIIKAQPKTCMDPRQLKSTLFAAKKSASTATGSSSGKIGLSDPIQDSILSLQMCAFKTNSNIENLTFNCN